MPVAEATVTPRLKTLYYEEIRPQLVEQFGHSSAMRAPRLLKITLNMGVGEAKQDARMMEAAQEQLATIAGQQPNIRRARKSIANFKLREQMPVGVSVTLRDARMYEFLDRLTSVALPRVRDFRGLSPRSFDGRGNYSMGIREQIIFPEIDYDASIRYAGSTSPLRRRPRATRRPSRCCSASACPSRPRAARARATPMPRPRPRRSGARRRRA